MHRSRATLARHSRALDRAIARRARMSRAGADAARASPTRGTHRGDAMAVGDDGARALFAWGCGEDGQLGLDDARSTARERCAASPRRVALEATTPASASRRGEATPRAPACGSRNSMCATTTGELYAWGWNSHRALSFGWQECDALFVDAPRRSRLEVGEGGRRLEVAAAASGGWHALCVDADGAVWGWGGNEYAQAGRADAEAEARSAAIPDRDWAPARALISPARMIPLPFAVSAVSCGGMSSFALLRDGRVFEWGLTSEEEEPREEPAHLPTLDKHVVEIAAGSFHLLMRTRNGEVLSYGNGMYGQLGLGAFSAADKPRVIETFGRVGVAKIAAGGWHSAAVTAGGLLYTWGRGEYGRLGHGDDCKDKVVPQLVDLGEDESNFIADVALGGSHSCAITCEGHVLSWGRNTLGRLGRVVSDPSPSCGHPGRVVFPPLPGGRFWRVDKISCGGRHTLAVAVAENLPSAAA